MITNKILRLWTLAAILCYESVCPYYAKPYSFFLPCGLLCGLRHLAFNHFLGDLFDDTDGDCLSHVTDSKSSQRWVRAKGLHTHGFAGDKSDHTGVTRFQSFGGVFQLFAGTTVNLFFDLLKFAGNVGCVTVQDRGIAILDLSWVVQDNNLKLK